MCAKRTILLAVLLSVFLAGMAFAVGSSGTISVKDYGAIGDGSTDDTLAIQAAANAAVVTRSEASSVGTTIQTGPALLFPEGKYVISGPVSLNSVLEVRGVGRPIIFQSSATSDIFTSTNAWRMSIRNITFSGGRNQIDLSNAAADFGQIVIDHCRFYGAFGFSIKNNVPSSSVKISDGVFTRCYQAWNNQSSDYASMKDCWVYSGGAENKAVIEHHGAMMLIENVCGVPDYWVANRRYVDNYGEWLMLRMFRAGGENGAMCPIFNYRKYSNNINATDPSLCPSTIIVDNAFVCPGGTPSNCVVYCYEVPNSITIRDTTMCTGTEVILNPSLNMNSYFYVSSPSMLSYTVEDTIGEQLTQLPSSLRNPVIMAGLSGTIELEGYVGDKADVALRVELVQGGSVVRTDRVKLDSSGHFTLTNVTSGIYKVAVKAYASLRKEVSDVSVYGDTDMGNVVLQSGDLNGNSTVGSEDRGVVLGNLDKVGD